MSSKLSYQHTRSLYQNLLPQDEQPSLAACIQKKVSVDQDLHQDTFSPQILISKDLLNTLIKKLQNIKTTFINNHSVSSQALFEEISTVLGKYYQKLRLQFHNLETRQFALWGERIDGINYSYLSTLFSHEELCSVTHDKNLLKNEVRQYEPKELFEHCKRALIGQAPLDNLIKHHSQRKEKNLFNLQLFRKELKLLFQEGFTALESPRKAVDFLYDVEKLPHSSPLVQEMRSIMSCSLSAELKWLFTVERYFLRADKKVPKDLRASSLPVLGVFMKRRTLILTESEKYYLFDQQLSLKKNASLTGRSKVTYFPEKNPKFYLKQYPEFPGFEYASTLLMRLLGIEYLPYQDLILINKRPVLITQNAEGFPVHKIWEYPQKLKNLDPVHTGLLIIAAMLFNPEDGKEDNFILSPDGRFLIPIDNDHCFLPTTFQKNGGFWKGFTVNTALQIKTLLFCLEEMSMIIPNEVKQQIRDVDLLLQRWMTELIEIQSLYTKFVSAEQQNQFSENGTILKIPFFKQFIENLHWKAHKIQHILTKKSDATPFDLLKATEPFAARCYENSSKFTTLKERWNAVTEDLYPKPNLGEPRTSVLDTRRIMEIINISKEELKNTQQKDGFQIMEPADALVYLNKLIQDQDHKAKEEEEKLCELDTKDENSGFFNLFGKSVLETALQEFFTNPREGLALKGSKLITNRYLEALLTITPSAGIKIRFLSLPESPSLNHECIQLLVKGCPNLEYLNVNGCLQVKEIITQKDEWPLLARLEVRDCLNLEMFVSYSPLQILQIGTDKKIEITVKKPTLDSVLMVSLKTDQVSFSLKNSSEFELKNKDLTLSNSNLIHYFLKTGNQPQRFQNFQITIGGLTLRTEKDLKSFLNVINLNDFLFSTKEIQILSTIRLRRSKRLELSRTGIMTVDDLRYLVKGDWQRLNCLDLSGNKICDKGLIILLQGNWPLFETLILEETDITKKGLSNFLLNVSWPNFKEIKAAPFLQDFANSLLPKNWSFLEQLDFSSSNIDKDDLKIIVNRSKWPLLKCLNLSQTPTNDEGLEILCQGDWPLLETLMLKETIVTKRGLLNFTLIINWSNLKEIIATPSLQDFACNLLPNNWHLLEEIDLSFTNIDKNDIKVIVNQPKWPLLKLLNLSQTPVNDEGLEILAKGDWPLIETLILEETRITKKGLLIFLLSVNWPNFQGIIATSSLQDFTYSLLPKNWSLLEELDLSSSNISASEIKVMVDRTSWPQLKSLDLSNNSEIRNEGLEILCQGDWPLLEILNLQCTKIASVGIEMLVKKSKWSQLKYLNLSQTPVNDWGLGILCQGNWPLLETLMLNGASVTKKGVLNFILRGNWPNFQGIIATPSLQEFAYSLLPKNWSLLEELDLSSSNISASEIKVIVDRTSWPQLISLNLSKNSEICDEGLEILCQGGWPSLEILNLQSTKISSVGVGVLVKKSKWSQLKHLNLSENEINDQSFKLLCLGNWPELEILNIRCTILTPVGIQILAQKSKWPRLKCLNLSQNSEIQDQGLTSLCQGDWPFLETLILEETGITKKGLLNFLLSINWPNFKEISAIPLPQDFALNLLPKNWPCLEKLDLSSSNIEKGEIQVIVNRSEWPQLKSLDLSNNSEIRDEGLEIFCQGDWPLLEILNLQSTKISSVGIEMLVKKSKWSQLKHLNLSENSGIWGTGFKILCQGDWPDLENLDVHSTILTSVGIEMLVKKSKWSKLKHLNLSDNRVDDQALEILCLGNWPLLETLMLKEASATKKGLLNFIFNIDWPNFKEIIATPSLQDFAHGLLPKNQSLLKELDLSFCQITLNELEIVVKRFHFPNLKSLNLAKNQIRSKELEVLVQGNWPSLEILNLQETQVTVKEVEEIVNMSNWPQLKHLNLAGNQITDNALAILCRGNWPLLETLDLGHIFIPKKPLSLSSYFVNANWPNFKSIKLEWDSKSLSTDTCRNFVDVCIKKDLSQVERLDFNELEITLTEFEPILKNNQYQIPRLKFLKMFKNDASCQTDSTSILTLTECPLLQELDLENSKLSFEGIKAIVSHSKWLQLQQLNLSNHEIFDDGFSTLALGDWPKLENLNLKNTKMTKQGVKLLVSKMKLPNLKKLNISHNAIFDEGLKILASAKWPLFEHLVYCKTKVTLQGLVTLLENLQWPDLQKLELSFSESFDNFNKNSPKIIRSLVLMSDEKFDRFPKTTVVLNTNWLNSKEIHLCVEGSDFYIENIRLLPHDKWDQLGFLKLFVDDKPKIERSQSIVCPRKLRILDVSDFPLPYENRFGSLCIENCGNLEELHLKKTGISAQGLKKLINKSNLYFLQKLDLSFNPIHDEGFEIIASAKWHDLSSLDLSSTEITAQGIKNSISRLKCHFLMRLDVSHNRIQNRGLEMLISLDWNLKFLNLEDTGITDEGILILGRKSNWPNLKELRVSGNQIHDKGLKVLSSIKWLLLENLYLNRLQITEKGVANMISLSHWPNIKILDFSENEKMNDELVSLVARKWPFLKNLKINNANLGLEALKRLRNISSRSHLETKSSNFQQKVDDAWPEARGLSKVNVWPENYTFSEDDTWPEAKALPKENGGLLGYF